MKEEAKEQSKFALRREPHLDGRSGGDTPLEHLGRGGGASWGGRKKG